MTTIRLRRDTSTNWNSTNPILALGEAGVETNTNRVKIGDGVQTWSEIEYLRTPWSSVDSKPVINTQETSGLLGGGTLVNEGLSLSVDFGEGPYQVPRGNEVLRTSTVLETGVGLSGGGNISAGLTISGNFGYELNQIPHGNEVVRLSTNQTVGGVKTFSSIPLLPADQPTLANQAVGKGYVDARSLPTGGATGQILLKSSASNYDTYWGNMTLTEGDGISVGGTTISVDGTVTRNVGNQIIGGQKTFTGRLRVEALTEFGGPLAESVTNANATGTHTIQLGSGSIIRRTVTGNTTFLFGGLASSNENGRSFVLIITHSGNGRVINWASNIHWPGGTKPGLSSTSGSVDILTFVSADNGTTWFGFLGGVGYSW